MAPPLHSLPLPSAEIEPLPLIVPLASVKSPEADASLIVSVLLTVSVPSQVLSMSRVPTVFATSTIAVPYSLSVDVKSAVSDAPGTPADQLPALLQLSFPPDLAERRSSSPSQATSGLPGAGSPGGRTVFPRALRGGGDANDVSRSSTRWAMREMT